MKKQIVLVLIAVLLIILSSCKETLVSETTIKTAESNWNAAILQTTESDACPCNTTCPSATSPVFTTEKAIAETPFIYEDTFESFMAFPSGKGYFFGKVTFERYETEGIPFVFFRVIGMEEAYTGEFMVYLVQIEDMFGIENFDTEKTYRMAWRGHLEKQLYGRPPLEVGKTYGRFLGMSEEGLQTIELWQAGLIYDVKEENEKRYLYAYGTDLSIYNCKIPITDSEENSIYKQGKHDKAIAKLKELGQVLPTFDYKVEAEEFYRELN